MQKGYRVAFRSVLELVALGSIKVDTALRRIYAVIAIIEAEKLQKVKTRPVSVIKKPLIFSRLGSCTWGIMPPQLNNKWLRCCAIEYQYKQQLFIGARTQ